jgi:hypothetical protein
VFYGHDFPLPHTDSSIQCLLNYRGSLEKFSFIAQFAASVRTERVSGHVSARCHDEQRNFLALNLMHDIVAGAKTVPEARDYYAKEVLDYRRGGSVIL